MYDFEKAEIERKAQELVEKTYDTPLSEFVRGDSMRGRVVVELCSMGVERVGELATMPPICLTYLTDMHLEVAKRFVKEAFPQGTVVKPKPVPINDLSPYELRVELRKALRRSTVAETLLKDLVEKVTSLKNGFQGLLARIDLAIGKEDS